MNTKTLPSTAAPAKISPAKTLLVKTLPATISAVLFDMDGTLVDSDAAVARSWAYWANLRGVDLDKVTRTTPGRPAIESLAELAPWLSPAERLADAADLLRRERLDLVDILPTQGAVELVAALDGWSVPYAVVTSADEALARTRLETAGLPVPEVLITASTVVRGKPDPEGFVTAAEQLGVRPEECLVVEDSPAGVRAGLAAGAFVASVREVPAAHLIVKHLAALHHLLTPTTPASPAPPVPPPPLPVDHGVISTTRRKRCL